MLQKWRLIKDKPGDPVWNMAVDEALARMHNEQISLPTLRLYTWAPPALSLGYFQKTNGIRFDELQRLGITPVRRITGGRAVLHSGDLTYSLIVSSKGKMPAGVSASYRYICKGLLAAFAILGIDAALGSDRSGRGAPDMCFALSTGADIVFNGKKFVGSAQKRIGSTLLQHGSILLRPQTEILCRIFENQESLNEVMLSMKVTSLQDILGRNVDQEEVVHAVVEGFAQTFKTDLVLDCLTDDEARTAYNIMSKYQRICREGEPSEN